jgi:hypothetical protein
VKFALKNAVITPDRPVFLSGFGGRDRPHEGVLDDLYARVLLMEHDKPLLIIQLDLTGGDRSFVIGIKRALHAEFGLAEDEILINFSHTHYSVYVTGEDPDMRRGMYSIAQERWPTSGDIVDYTEDIRYFHRLRDTLVALTRQCYAHLTEGRMDIAFGTSAFGCSRRLPTANGVKFKPNFDEPIDTDLFVIRLTDRNDRLAGIVFSYGCHPTSMRGNMISAEFVGAACAYLERQYPGAGAVFLQGCAGDVKMRIGAGDTFALTTHEEMRAAAAKLGEDVMRTLEQADFTQADGPFASKLLDLRLYAERWEIADHERTLRDESKSAYRKLRAQMVIDSIRSGTDRTFLPHWIQIWKFGGAATLIAMEGEIPSAYALKIKKLLRNRRVAVLGYSNGVSSYIPTRRWLEEGGYEVEAVVLHGLRGPLVPETEDMIIGAIARSELPTDVGSRE